MRPFDYTRATDPAGAVALAARPDAKYLAGGTNLVDLMKLGVETPGLLVDVTRLLPAGIEESAEGLRIGAGARNSDVAADPRVCCTLEYQGGHYYAMKSAMVHGTVTPLDGASVPELDERPDPVTGKPLTGPVYGVGLDNVVSFDFAKIQRRFEQS